MIAEDSMMILTVDVGAPVITGDVGGVTRRGVPLLGGTVTGGFEGIIMPGGTDWQNVWPNGMIELQARYTLQLEQGVVEIRSEGLRSGSPDVLKRLAAGEVVPSREYYFRTAIRFFTASPQLLRLNDMLAISVGERIPKQVRLAVHAVL
jgi:hypothetical protein